MDQRNPRNVLELPGDLTEIFSELFVYLYLLRRRETVL